MFSYFTIRVNSVSVQFKNSTKYKLKSKANSIHHKQMDGDRNLRPLTFNQLLKCIKKKTWFNDNLDAGQVNSKRQN